MQTSYAVASDRRPKGLQHKVSLSLKNQSLEQIVHRLSALADCNFTIDARAIEDIGLDVKELTWNFEAKDETVDAVLNRLLRNSGASWTWKNDVVVLTSPDGAEQLPHTRVYPVADLISVEAAQAFHFDGSGISPHVWSGSDFDTLIDAITIHVKPDSWDEVGGLGSVLAYRMGQSLVITNEHSVHEKIEDFLATLRRALKLQAENHPSNPPVERPLPIGRYQLSKDAPVEETIKLIREVYPQLPKLEKLGHGILIRANQNVLFKIRTLLLDLQLLQPSTSHPGGGGGF